MAKDAVQMETAIIIKTDATLGTIDDNFEDLKVAVGKKVMRYQGLIFADEDIREAKATKSELNGMINNIETSRKAIKRKWNTPLDDFEKRVKEVIAIIAKPMEGIDEQIKDFEERRKAAKDVEVKATVEKHLASIIGEKQAYIRSCGIEWDDRWLNATMSMNQVNADVGDQVSKMIGDINSLQDICEGDEMLPDILAVYMDTKNLAGSLQKRKAIMAQRETVRQMQEAAAARKKAAEEAEEDRQRMLAEEARLRKEQAEAPLIINAADTPTIEDLEYSEDGNYGFDNEADDEEAGCVTNGQAPPPATKQPSLFRVTFSVDASLDTMTELVNFMNSKSIPFKRVSQQRL